MMSGMKLFIFSFSGYEVTNYFLLLATVGTPFNTVQVVTLVSIL